MAAIVQLKCHIRKLVIIMILASGTHASMMAQAAFPLGDWTYQGIQHLEQASPEQLTALGAKAVVSG